MKTNDNKNIQQPLPHDDGTERAVLSTLMRYPDRFQQYSDLLDPSLFYFDKERAMYRCIEGVINEGGITDVNSLWNYYQSHELGYVLYRNDFVEIVTNANRQTLEQDILRLRDMSKRRLCWEMLIKASKQVLDMTNDLDDEVSNTIGLISEVQGDTGNQGISSHAEALQEVETMARENIQGKQNCLRTNFKLFDGHYLLRPDTLTVIAAFTSVGKSALAQNIVKNVAAFGVPSAYYSLEMSKAELASRSISKRLNLPASIIMNRRLTDEQMRNVSNVVASEKDLPIFYDDRSTVSFDKTIRSIRKMVKTKGVRLVVIDYLQIYAQMSDDQEASIAYMSRTCKNIAKELGIAVILISQLNRSGLHPSIKMLRGSGQIEESADNIVLIDRPDAYPDNKVTKFEGAFKDTPVKGVAKLILSKGRGVGTGCCLVRFDAEHTTFSDVEEIQGGKSYENQDEGLPF